MKFWWYALRCWLGKPVCYRTYGEAPPHIAFAMCWNCNRQSEVHLLGGADGKPPPGVRTKQNEY